MPSQDLRTRIRLPLSNPKPDGEGSWTTGRVICELAALGNPGPADLANFNTLQSACPRAIARRLLTELEAKHGLLVRAAMELEFTLGRFKEEGGGFEPLWRGRPIFSSTEFAHVQALFYELDAHLLSLGVDVQTLNYEYGEGQVELTMAPMWGIDFADNTVTIQASAPQAPPLHPK